MSYSQASSHRPMVFDTVRNALYAEAIYRVVTPESVVLDLGAGLGLHGLIAAAAGAKRVYLVEPEPVINVAMDVAKTHGLTDRIRIFEDRIENVELPEQVDAIISVFTGNLLFSEDLLPSLFHTRDRYLKPAGHLIPDLAELVLAPIADSDLHFEHIGRWSDVTMGLDYSATRRFAGNEILWLPNENLRCVQLAEETRFRTDLLAATSADCKAEGQCRIEQTGPCHGMLGWIRLRLGEHWLSSGPTAPKTHWSPAVLPIDPPLQLEADECVTMSLRRPAQGDWTWSLKAKAGSRRHSTFLARTDGPRRLRKMAPNYRPGLNKQGENMLRLLEMMRIGHSNIETARILAAADPESFRDSDAALKKAQQLAWRYGK